MERKNKPRKWIIPHDRNREWRALLVRSFGAKLSVCACVLIKLTKAQTSLIFVLFFRFFFFANVNWN